MPGDMKTLLLPTLLAALAGCVNEAALQADWDAFVVEHNTCEQPADCVLVYPDCPLGCGTAVRADAAEEADALAERLVSRYERGGQACAYDCLAFSVDCQANRCVAVAEDF